MINITIYKQSNYPVSAKRLKDSVKKVITQSGIVSDAEASVAIVGVDKITRLAQKYLGEDSSVASLHQVLSFPVGDIEKRFVFPPDPEIHLGEIVICYKNVTDEANKTGRLVEELMTELAEHGARHLVGIHHE